MSSEYEDEEAPEPAESHEQASSLSRPLQEHLAQKLRSAYHELAAKPAFLGDPAIPVEFDYHLQRLEAVEKARHSEKVRNQGIEAVKSALEGIGAGALEPGASAQGGRHRRGGA